MSDLIKRIDALVAIRNLYPAKPKIDFMDTISNWRQKNRQYMECERAIEELPSAEPSPENCWGCNCPKMVPPAELQPTCNKLATSCNQLATDCISRQAAIDAMEQAKEQYFDRRVIIGKMQDIVNNLPPVDIDLSDYSDRLWRNAYEQGKAVSKDVLDEAYAHGYTAAEADFHKQNQWTPVTERLPEEECKHYWICTDRGYQCECRWTNVNHFWTNLTTDWHWNIFDVPQYSHVVAWRPLPGPWKGGEE